MPRVSKHSTVLPPGEIFRIERAVGFLLLASAFGPNRIAELGMTREAVALRRRLVREMFGVDVGTCGPGEILGLLVGLYETVEGRPLPGRGFVRLVSRVLRATSPEPDPASDDAQCAQACTDVLATS